MIVNGNELYLIAPIKNMLTKKVHFQGVSHGASEAGYDIRIKQAIRFVPFDPCFCYPDNAPEWVGDPRGYVSSKWDEPDGKQHGMFNYGKFILASAMEEFDMPGNLVGIVHDKSTWARRGLSVFNTVIESGWKGFLTLELVYHGTEELVIPAGSGIAQVVFHRTNSEMHYSGKYQNQEDKPVEAIKST